MIPPVYDESELPERLRQLVAMEIERVVDDLTSRREFLLEIWSRHRDRTPLLDTIFTRWRSVAMTDLALLPTEAIAACELFHRELEELRLYFRFTEDMPTTMGDVYTGALARITEAGALAVRMLGGAPPRPVIDFTEIASAIPRLSLLTPPPEPSDEPG